MISIELTPTNLTFRYTNHRGLSAVRSIVARRLIYGTSEFYPGQPAQWYIEGFDHDRNEQRAFQATRMQEVA